MLITGVGLLIHIYSIGYMAHDPKRRLFFAYLNLFIAAMLMLVLADNYLLLYLGWEGVGLASFLLIGFWQYKNSAAVAAKKAFVMNRVGDVGLSIAVMLMFVTFGTVTFQNVFEAAPQASETTITLIGLALLLAAVGKSAQFPLQAWLLDAMEGTPVSAFIHAATMVTAGVHLVIRSNAIFDLSTTAVTVVLAIGVITMLMGAWIACAGRDQEVAGGLHDEPDRLHVPGRRTGSGGLRRVRDLPPAHARHVQGRPVPERRLGQRTATTIRRTCGCTAVCASP